MSELNPYAAPAATVGDAPVTSEFRLAGRGERLGAVIIDAIIHTLIFVAIGVAIFLSTGVWQQFIEMSMRGEQLPWFVTMGLPVAGFILYVLVQGYPLAATGQTWGKRLLKLRIVDRQGNKPDLLRLLGLRYGVGWAISMVPYVGMLYSLVDALLIFRADKRCIHDHIAGTRVVVAD